MTPAARSGVAAQAARAARFHQTGDLRAALVCYDAALALDPGNAVVHCERGNVLADLGQADLAIASYDRAIVLAPDNGDPHDFRGIVLAQTGRMPEALASFDRALALDPGNVNALNNRANVLKVLDRLDEALAAQDRVVSLLPDFAPGHNNRGNTLIALGRLDEAVASFDRALALDPTQIQSHANRANALVKLLRVEEAIESFRRALALDPRQPEMLVNLAELLWTLARPDEAAQHYEQALRLEPGNVDAHIGLGDILLERSRPDLAAASFQRAIALDPENAVAFGHMGIALVRLDRRKEALACFDRAVTLDPQDPQTWQSRGHLLLEIGEVEGALASHDRTLAIAPAFPYELGSRFHTAMRLAQWSDFDRHCALLRQSVAEGGRLIAPFDLATTVDDPMLQRRCAELFVRHELPDVREVPIAGRYPRRERIRIGYFSADFRDHATMRLLLEMFEAHDRDSFDLTAISFGPEIRDASRFRTEQAVDRFVDVRARSNAQIVALSRELGIDIAVDLKGYTQGHRAAAFIERLAPVQASYLGYPGTSGIAAMDYLIADAAIVPAGHEEFYSEKIVFLPGSYQPNLRIGAVPRTADRAAMGLPEGRFVYCCFNQSYKVTPHVFASWMRVLTEVPQSVLWLWVNEASARSNLQRAAAEQGIAPDRLVFAARLPSEQHLDRLRLADLFLDTLPCNAHTTASDALRMGLPVLTCPGQSFAARVATSLLQAMDLPELIAADARDYEARAIAFGSDAARFARIREKVARNRETCGLFDPAGTARKLEAAYRAMYERCQADLPPAHIRV